VVVDAAPEMPRGGGGGDEKHSGGKRKKKDDAMDAVSPEDGTDGKTLGERARDAERGLSTRSTHGDAEANDALAGAIGDALGDVQNAKRPPRADSLAVLFAQALAAEDRSLIERCLSVGDAGVVSNTVARLPASSVPKLLRAALDRMRAKPARGEQIARWMRAAMLHHASHIASSAAAKTAVLELTQTVEQHRALQRPLQALLGRLDLLLHKQSEAKRARGGGDAGGDDDSDAEGPVNVYDEGDEDLEDVMEEGDEESDWETDGEEDSEGEEEEDSDDDESDSE
jgi:U3 small nucleolar RNA-associated protein 5